MSRETDPRVDKAAGWLINGLVFVALAVGAFFFKSLSGDIKALSHAVTMLSTKVAVMEVTNKRIDDLQAELKTIRAEQLKRTASVYKVRQIENRLAALEAK